MSACLSGAAAYSFDLEKVKSPPSTSTTTTTRATSPSSTLSESSNSPLAISTRKPRTARKRPNQTYNEAAALLSSAYPNIFFSNDKDNKKTSQFFSKSPLLSDTDDGSELLLSYESIEEPDFLFHQPKSEFFLEQHKEEVSSSRGGGGFQAGEVVESIDFSDEFDAESILDEEIEEGIDSIMGNVESNSGEENQNLGIILNRSSKGIKTAGNLPLGLGLRSALRENDEANLMRFHTVDFEQISPRIQTTTATDEVKSETTKKVVVAEKSKKKKKKKVAAVSALAPAPMTESVREEIEERSSPLLKLNFDGILKAWSDKASPFADESLGSEATGADVNARLAQIDLFGDSGMREASVLRYKEKRRTRLYSKKIRYEVRKLNADQRPRMKGRFVRRPNESSPSGER